MLHAIKTPNLSTILLYNNTIINVVNRHPSTLKP
jgi:hypothetical protein